tara:strand:- start:668 stop:805 length:138 start_codon:yes stop_codon:yes gene_type:complete
LALETLEGIALGDSKVFKGSRGEILRLIPSSDSYTARTNGILGDH